MAQYRNYIAGELVGADEWIDVENPYTQQIIGQAAKGGEAEANQAVEAAVAAYHSTWPKLPPEVRAGYLKRFAQLIRDHQQELTDLLIAEQAKIAGLAGVEIGFTASYFDYYAGWADIYTGEVINSSSARGDGTSNENIWLNWKPIGPVAGICPWNFPFFVMARKVAPAILTGCPIVVKPSSTTPLTTLRFAELIAENIPDLPKGALSFVAGGGSTLGVALTKHPDIQMVSLTGSVEAGVEIVKNSADKVMKTSLELGGKAPAIVFPDADMDLAVKGVTDSRLIFSGQVCNCCERAYVHESIYDEFVSKLKAAFEAAQYGDPNDPASVYSSQVDRAQLEKIDAATRRAEEQGATILTGGRVADRPTGYFFQPTIVEGAAQDSDVVRKEVFGPVLPVVKWSDYDQVIAWANDCEYGLTSSVFSTNVNTVMRAVKDLDFGETYVNREHFEGLQGFHAGWRKSGIGGADGKHGLYEYLQSQVVYLRY
ncbi:MAG: aldehyde dehydrogenase [Propionibacteriaceae bacterium]|jgi:lactaldehyde dehydrogenase/glycolaldehyde dehydrogenase|nr:aldehyde dehydrogenase [Propionibacteriaceae bacterium]